MRILEHGNYGVSLQFTPCSTMLATSGGTSDALWIWSLATDARVSVRGREGRFGFSGGAGNIRFDPRGARVFYSDYYGLRVADAQSGERDVLPSFQTAGGVCETRRFALDTTGTHLVGHKLPPQHDRTDLELISIRDPGTAAEVIDWAVSLPPRTRDHNWRWGLTFFPSGDRFAAIEVEGRHTTHLVVRDANTGRVLDRVSGWAAESDEVVISPDGKTVVTRRAAVCYVLDAADLSAPPREVRNGNFKKFTSLAFHPSGKYLAAASNDETVKLYDTRSWSVVRTFTWEIGRMRSVAFSPDGTLAAAGSDKGKVVVWDVDV